MGYGRNPYQAVQDFRSSLQRVISCVTDSVVTVQGARYDAGSEHALVLGAPEAATLARSAIALSIRAYARVAERQRGGPWRADLTSYFYALRDSEGREIVAYHWHPDSRSSIRFPQLHLGAGGQIGREELQKSHIPTGYIELEDVIGLAIREFGVRPRRDDWAEVLGFSRSD